ncbi:MAG: rod-binding protein [Pseudomonadota bacterium]
MEVLSPPGFGTLPEPSGANQKTAKEFEASYLRVMLSAMMEGVDQDSITGGGGQAEDNYKQMLTEQYAEAISASGGIGIADQVMKELIKLQEQSQ